MKIRIKQILSVSLSILVSTMLVAGAATAATTIGSNIATAGDITVNTDKFVVTGSSGNTAIAGPVTLSGTTATGLTLSGTNSTAGISFTGNTETLIKASGAAAAAAVKGIVIGTSAVGSGIPLSGTNWQGNAFYADDGSVALTGATENLNATYTTSVAISGDVSASSITAGMNVGANYTSTAGSGLSGVWGVTSITSGVTVTNSASGAYGDVAGGHFSINLPSGAIVAANSHLAGISVGGNLGGTHTGDVAAIRIRKPSTGSWDYGLVIPAAAAAAMEKGIVVGTSTVGGGIPLSGTNWQGNAFYADDGGVALTGATENLNATYTTSVAINGDISASSITAGMNVGANYTSSAGSGLSGVWGVTSITAGKTVDTSAGYGDVAGGHFSINLPSTAVVAASSNLAGISVGGNLGGTHTGTVSAIRIRRASAGDWDYGIDMNDITAIGTADIRLSNGALIVNGDADTLTITEGTVAVVGNLSVSGTFSPAITSLAGDLDIVGTDLQATTGTLNVSKSGSMTTVKGTLNVDEAATLDSTLKIGTLSSDTPGSGLAISAATPRAVDINVDDGNAAIAQGTLLSAGRFRLMKYADSITEDYAVHGLTKYSGLSKGGWGAGVMGAVETTGAVTLAGQSDNLITGVLGRFGTAATLNTNTANDRVAGVTAFNNNVIALTGSGKSVGLLVMESINGTPVDFDYGVEVRNSVATTGVKIGTTTTGIDVGAATTGIALTGAQTTGISMTGAMTTGMDITGTGAVVTGIDIGTTTTTGISFTGGSATLINASAAAAAASTRGIFLGEDSNSAQSGIPLLGANWSTSQGNALYCDDDGVALTGYTECLTTRMLTTAAVTTGDVSTAAFHPDLTLNASYTGTGGLSAIWGNTTIMSGKTIDTSAGLGDVGGGTFGLDLSGTLAANSFGTGVSVGLGGSGTKTGIITGFRMRAATGTVDWDGILSIEDGDGSWTGMTKTAASATATMTNSPKSGNPAYWLKIYIGTTEYYFPVWTD